MQSLIRSKSAGVTGGRGTAGAGPGRDLLYSGPPTPSSAAQRSGSQRSAAARSATQRQRRVRHGASSAVQSIALTAPRP